MKGVIFNDGFDVLQEDLNELQSRIQAEVKRRILDIADPTPGYGIIEGLGLSNPSAYTVRTAIGKGYDAVGEFCELTSQQDIVVSAPDVGDYVLLKYLSSDGTARSHPITGASENFRTADGFQIVAEPTIGDGIPLGKITAIDGSGNVTFDTTAQVNRYYWSSLIASGMIVDAQLDPTSEVYKHVFDYRGSGTWATTNPHALAPIDIGVDETSVPVHQKKFHANGIVLGSAASLLSMTVDGVPAYDRLLLADFGVDDVVVVQGENTTSLDSTIMEFQVGVGSYPQLYQIYFTKDGEGKKSVRAGLTAAQTIPGVWLVDVSDNHGTGNNDLDWDGTTDKLWWNGNTSGAYTVDASYDGFVKLYGPDGVNWVLVYIDASVLLAETGVQSDTWTISAGIDEDLYYLIGNVNFSGSGLPYQYLLGYGNWGTTGDAYDKRLFGTLEYDNIRDDFKEEEFELTRFETVKDAVVSGLELYLPASASLSYSAGVAYVGGRRVVISEGSQTFHQPSGAGSWDYWLSKDGVVSYVSATNPMDSADYLDKQNNFVWLGWASYSGSAFESPVVTGIYPLLDTKEFDIVVGPDGSRDGSVNGVYALNRMLAQRMADNEPITRILLLEGEHKIISLLTISQRIYIEGESRLSKILPDDSVSSGNMITMSTGSEWSELKKVYLSEGAASRGVLGLTTAGAVNLVFSDCYVDGLVEYDNGAQSIKWFNCVFYNAGAATYGTHDFSGPAQQVYFENCEFDIRSSGIGLRINVASGEEVGDVSLDGCRLDAGKGAGGGILVQRLTYGILNDWSIDNCKINGNTEGVLFYIASTSTDKGAISISNSILKMPDDPTARSVMLGEESSIAELDKVTLHNVTFDFDGVTNPHYGTGNPAIGIAAQLVNLSEVFFIQWSRVDASLAAMVELCGTEVNADGLYYRGSSSLTGTNPWSAMLFINENTAEAYISRMMCLCESGGTSVGLVALYVDTPFYTGSMRVSLSDSRLESAGNVCIYCPTDTSNLIDLMVSDSIVMSLESDAVAIYSGGGVLKVSGSRITGDTTGTLGHAIMMIGNHTFFSIVGNIFGPSTNPDYAVYINILATTCPGVFMSNGGEGGSWEFYRPAAVSASIIGIETDWTGGRTNGQPMILNENCVLR